MSDRDETPKTDERATWTDRRELRVRATPEQMYRAWADPEIIAGWFADRAAGEAASGGEIVHYFDAFGMELKHDVVEAEAPTKLILDGRSPTGEPFRQKIHVGTDGGETVLELVHSGFVGEAEWDDEYEGIDSGWQLALAILRHYLENHFERPKSTIQILRPADFAWDRLADLFRTDDGLARWLTADGAIGEVGSEAELELRDAGALTGTVLADSGRELALEWRQVDGVLELKAFGGGPWPTTLGLRLSSWSEDRESILERVRPALEASVERLVGVVAG